MQSFSDYLEIVNKAIAAVEYPAQPAHLYEPIAYTMSLGGKRLRPVLTLMACEAFGTPCEAAINQAVGLEFYHNFTLLHDDVMDKADVRRGKPTVHCRWDENTAILSGDAMLTTATIIMSKALADKLPAVMDIFNRTAMEIYEGQQWDMDFESRNDVTVDEYIEMIRLKTSVLFGAACRLGSVIAGADEASQEALYGFAMELGLAFQLQDDYLDTYGDPATFGKEIGGDILNAKKTFMLISAYRNADKVTTERLDALFAINDKSRNAEKIAGVKAIYDKLEIPRLCTEQIDSHLAKSLEWLDKVSFKDDGRKAFEDYVNMLVNRDK